MYFVQTASVFEATLIGNFFSAGIDIELTDTNICPDDEVELVCRVSDAQGVILQAPPYVNEANRIEINLGSTETQRVVNGVTFLVVVDVTEVTPTTSDFVVTLRVSGLPSNTSVTFLCGNGTSDVSSTLSPGGKLMSTCYNVN